MRGSQKKSEESQKSMQERILTCGPHDDELTGQITAKRSWVIRRIKLTNDAPYMAARYFHGHRVTAASERHDGLGLKIQFQEGRNTSCSVEVRERKGRVEATSR